jgi:hypothetical protein
MYFTKQGIFIEARRSSFDMQASRRTGGFRAGSGGCTLQAANISPAF